MFLVMKRFIMDDVPLCLVATKNKAVAYVSKDQAKDRYATPAQQIQAGCDIGTEACAYMIVEFNSKGFPITNYVFPLEN